jgi:hypothetical protein
VKTVRPALIATAKIGALFAPFVLIAAAFAWEPAITAFIFFCVLFLFALTAVWLDQYEREVRRARSPDDKNNGH